MIGCARAAATINSQEIRRAENVGILRVALPVRAADLEEEEEEKEEGRT